MFIFDFVADAMLFNILSYMSNELLTNGHTAASIDEFYLFLTNLTAVEYIRNFMKRVRKKDSAVILARLCGSSGTAARWQGKNAAFMFM